MNFKFYSKRNLIIGCGILILLILIYNFKTANSLKYEAGGDAFDYIHLAKTLAKSGTYGHTSYNRGTILEMFKTDQIEQLQIKDVKPTAFRPPVWPYLIAGIFILFGYNFTYVLIFKFLLHLLGIFIFYKTLKILKLKEVLILIGCLFFAIHPAWQIYSRVFLSEPITMFFLTLWVYLLVAFLQKKMSFLPQAIVSGVLILSHPYYLFFPISVWLVMLIKKQLNFKIFLLSGAISSAIISTWIIRNFIVLDTDEIVITTSSGAVMAKGWNSKISIEHTNTKGDLADESLVLQGYAYDKTITYNEVEKSQLYTRAVLAFIKNNPDKVPLIILTKLKSAFNPFPETPKSGFLETGRVIFQVLSLLALVYVIFLSKNNLIRSFALALVFSTVLITSLTYSGFRFRMPQGALELLLILTVLNEIYAKERNFRLSSRKNTAEKGKSK